MSVASEVFIIGALLTFLVGEASFPRSEVNVELESLIIAPLDFGLPVMGIARP